MNWKVRSYLGLGLLATSALTGCGKDSTGPGSALDQATSIEIFSKLMTQVLTLGFSSFSMVPNDAGTALPGAQVVSANTVLTIAETVPCDGGGNVAVSGTYTTNLSDQGTGSIVYDFRQKPNNCRLGTSQGVYTVNGNPDFHISGNMSFTGWSPVSYTFAYDGGFTWTGRGGTGGCTMNLQYNYNFANPQQVAMSGSICGYTY